MKHAGEDETGICRPALQRVSHHAARHGDDWLRFLDGTARVACCPRRRGSPPAVQQHSVVTTCSLGSRSSADRITTDCCRLGNQVSHATWRGECSNRRTELPTYSRWCSFSIGLPLYDAPLCSVYSWFNSPCKQSWTLMQVYVLFMIHCNALW